MNIGQRVALARYPATKGRISCLVSPANRIPWEGTVRSYRELDVQFGLEPCLRAEVVWEQGEPTRTTIRLDRLTEAPEEVLHG